MDGLFVERLREMMRSWNWTEDRVEKALPKIVQVCIEVGIMVKENDELVLTELSNSTEAWDTVWSKVDINEGEAG